MARRKKPPSSSCKGWNFHVFALCSERCSICGIRREELRDGLA